MSFELNNEEAFKGIEKLIEKFKSNFNQYISQN